MGKPVLLLRLTPHTGRPSQARAQDRGMGMGCMEEPPGHQQDGWISWLHGGVRPGMGGWGKPGGNHRHAGKGGLNAGKTGTWRRGLGQCPSVSLLGLRWVYRSVSPSRSARSCSPIISVLFCGHVILQLRGLFKNNAVILIFMSLIFGRHLTSEFILL